MSGTGHNDKSTLVSREPLVWYLQGEISSGRDSSTSGVERTDVPCNGRKGIANTGEPERFAARIYLISIHIHPYPYPYPGEIKQSRLQKG